jgi:hypothetical protein
MLVSLQLAMRNSFTEIAMSRTPPPPQTTDSSEHIRALARDEDERSIAAHKETCEAARGYQRMVGALAILTLLFTGIVWLGKASLRSEIAEIVRAELDRRLPAQRGQTSTRETMKSVARDASAKSLTLAASTSAMDRR